VSEHPREVPLLARKASWVFGIPGLVTVLVSSLKKEGLNHERSVLPTFGQALARAISRIGSFFPSSILISSRLVAPLALLPGACCKFF
jgi:hypothetical protein